MPRTPRKLTTSIPFCSTSASLNQYYSVSRAGLVALDTVSLIRSVLPKEANWLKQSGAVTQLSAATLLLLSTLNNVFLQEKASGEAGDADHPLWCIRFENARQRLREA